jgi:hypothetical protein
MSHRLQVLIPEPLDRQISKAAQRLGVSKGEWVRRAPEEALRPRARVFERPQDPLDRLASLDAPTGDVADMLGETDELAGQVRPADVEVAVEKAVFGIGFQRANAHRPSSVAAPG